MSSPHIQPANIKVLSTVHQNFEQRIDNLFNVWNSDNPDVLGGYNQTTALVQEFLGEALAKNKSVRVLGGNWSWTKVGFTRDWIVNTSRLNRMKRILPEEINGRFEPDKYLFAQCGCNVMELNRVLESLGRSMITSGASNGQTIAGLISNCTHGSAIDIGPTPDFVVGLHLILGPERHVYLERKSDGVVTDRFVEKIGAERISDDALFNAALVSFGSFGFIHGVMIETAPRYLLNAYRKLVPAASLQAVMNTLDFSRADVLPRPRERPFHFQVIINPYEIGKGFYLTVMYKEAYRQHYGPRILPDLNTAGPGEDAPILLGRLTENFPAITPLIIKQTLKTAYKELNGVWGTHGEVFAASLARGKVLSCAIAISIQDTSRVIDIALRLNKEYSFVGVFACRYVRQTRATLGFIKYPFTCIVEFDSFESESTWRFYKALWLELDNVGISYTFHWGKVNNLDAARLRKMYGRKIDEWMDARSKLLSPGMAEVFTNDFMREVGLEAVVV